MKRILAVAPHPDDETLGCGGTILKHKTAGDHVSWLIVTNIAVADGYEGETVEARQHEIARVAQEYSFDDLFKLDFPTTKLDVLPKGEMIRKVADVIGKVKPDIVYGPHAGDVHSDHRIVFDILASSLKTFRFPFVKRFLMYEVLSETEFSPPLATNSFLPNSFSDITPFLERKLAIMELYRGEIQPHPFPRSVENVRALATWRGATAGVPYGEAFVLLKECW
ncbi:MAG TPA: PIG-L family deacetylase [Syntrophales bacterium]|nr:PIG-L family deacetylase [Syntrophales bacterium]